MNYKQHNPKEKDSDGIHTNFIHKSSCFQKASLPIFFSIYTDILKENGIYVNKNK